MNKSTLFGNALRMGTLVSLLFCAVTVFGQEAAKLDTITSGPAGIYILLKPSCMPCHSNEGRDKPRNAVNFSVWEKYSSMEKMMLASSIQNEVQKGNMPPKGFLKTHPESILDSLQIIKITQWCDSLKATP